MRLQRASTRAPSNRQNILIIVFDAFSGRNLFMDGYARRTTPKLDRLAKRAIVYHNHYATSNYTTSGTGSLLTGVLPWTHRALQANTGVAEKFVDRNVFSAFADYHRLAYTHNPYAYTFLRQFQAHIDELVPMQRLFLESYSSFLWKIFEADPDASAVSWARNTRLDEDGYAYSLLVSHIYQALQDEKVSEVSRLFPLGLPSTGYDYLYLQEQATDWLSQRLPEVPQPFLGYFHFFPPHDPYHPPAEFHDRFAADGFTAPRKPLDVFADEKQLDEVVSRQRYDEFVLYVDREFDRLYRSLEASGLLENTWIVLTSDHGEMFERGIVGHSTYALYEPVIRVPLLIFEPGRETGLDIQSPTSAVDLLPTLTHIAGQAMPDWTEGLVLPPFSSTEPDPERSIYVQQARQNKNYAPLTNAATALVKGPYKLHYYFGYETPKVDALTKLYDIHADPEELQELGLSQKGMADRLLGELKARLIEINRLYE